MKVRTPLLGSLRLDFLRLRPYGDHLLTPAVAVWIRFAWIVIFLMASIEGIVWGLVGATMTPRGAPWLAPFAGLFMLVLMFTVIWIVDASLIMSERPFLRARRWGSGQSQGLGALLRWSFGIAIRLGIVAISLYVTAPFLAKLIRADDIAAYHQRQVEQYFSQRDAQLQAQISERTAQIDRSYREQVAPVEAAIGRLTESLAQERERRNGIEAEYGPELAILRNDVAGARQRMGDEILGRNGRPSGRGPQARKWEANAELIAEQLAAKQAEMDKRTAETAGRIAALEESLRAQAAKLQALAGSHQQRVDQIAEAVKAEQVDPSPPKLSFAARSRTLQALRDSPEERGVPHFETVEGFSQAALGVLFLALIALKLFEPGAVRAYFSETVQSQYKKYLAGGLDDIPGFELPPEAHRRLDPVEFYRLWSAYEKDPAGFFADRRALVEVREPLTQFLAAQSLEHDRIAHRREHLEHEMLFARRRREHELAAYDRELSLRTAQLQTQLANETQALSRQRRAELASELRRARMDWEERKTREEEELKLLRDRLEEEQRQGREALKLRAQEIEHLKDRTLTATRRAEVAKQQAHAQKLAEIETKRQREMRKARLTGIREELARLRALESKQRTERSALQDTSRKLREALDGTLARERELEEGIAAQDSERDRLSQLIARHRSSDGAQAGKKTGFWPRAERIDGDKTAKDLAKDLKAIERSEQTERERLARLRDELRACQLRHRLGEDQLRESDDRLAATEMRIQLYEDSLRAQFEPESEEESQASTEAPGEQSVPAKSGDLGWLGS